MKRGEVWTVSAVVRYAGKPRPAVIVHEDRFEATSSITIWERKKWLVSFTSPQQSDCRFRTCFERCNALRCNALHRRIPWHYLPHE